MKRDEFFNNYYKCGIWRNSNDTKWLIGDLYKFYIFLRQDLRNYFLEKEKFHEGYINNQWLISTKNDPNRLGMILPIDFL